MYRMVLGETSSGFCSSSFFSGSFISLSSSVPATGFKTFSLANTSLKSTWFPLAASFHADCVWLPNCLLAFLLILFYCPLYSLILEVVFMKFSTFSNITDFLGNIPTDYRFASFLAFLGMKEKFWVVLES